MKNVNLFFFFICLLYSNIVLADPMKGYYIDLKGDTSFVTFDIPLYLDEPYYPWIQSDVKYFDSIGTVVKLKPNITKTYCFLYRDNLIKMVSCRTNGTRIADKFLRLQVDGKLKLFISYSSPGSWPLKNPLNKNYIYQKGDQELLFINPMNFKNQMSEYLREYPELIKKITNKIYGFRDSEQIAKEYNAKLLTELD